LLWWGSKGFARGGSTTTIADERVVSNRQAEGVALTVASPSSGRFGLGSGKVMST
jgi:hypothetical protein